MNGDVHLLPGNQAPTSHHIIATATKNRIYVASPRCADAGNSRDPTSCSCSKWVESGKKGGQEAKEAARMWMHFTFHRVCRSCSKRSTSQPPNMWPSATCIQRIRTPSLASFGGHADVRAHAVHCVHSPGGGRMKGVAARSNTAHVARKRAPPLVEPMLVPRRL